MPNSSRRSNVEIIYSILKACESGAKITEIIYRVVITTTKWKELEFLLHDGYLREDLCDGSKVFTAEERGKDFIKRVDDFREFTGYNPRIIPDKNIQLRQIPKKTEQKPISHIVYPDRLSTVLRDLSQINSKIMKGAVRTFDGVLSYLRGYHIQISPSLVLVLKKRKRVSFEILQRESNSSVYSRVYSSAFYPPEDWYNLPTETQEGVISKLEELKKRSRLIMSRKYIPEKTVVQKNLTTPEYAPGQVISTKPTPRTHYTDQRVLDATKKFLSDKMTSLKHYKEEDVKRLLSLFVKEGGELSLSLDPSSLFNSLRRVGLLGEYKLMGGTYYELRKRS
jgi:predicted transcriptional regulator